MTVHATRLADLRQFLDKEGGDGFVIPRTDAYQGEHVAPCDERLAWLTGFTGSAGVAIVLKDKAALFVDGRYTLQAQSQVDTSLYEICPLFESPPWVWASQHVAQSQKVLYDPWLHTLNDKNQALKALKPMGATFIPAASNLIDQLWKDRPPPPYEPLRIHDVLYAGASSASKRQQVAEQLHKLRADAVILSALESIAWLLNIRGNDIPYTPVAQGFAIFWADTTVDLFMAPSQISPQVKTYLGTGVRLHDPAALENVLLELDDETIMVDPAVTPLALVEKLGNCKLIHHSDPCALPKAVKNTIEVDGARQAHIIDGIAVTRFLYWLSQHAHPITELEVAGKLLAIRQADPQFKGPSFETISGSGPHGAIVHYRVTPETNRTLDQDSLLLLDSGGQYLTGTTDITRTIAIGKPSPEHKDRFTRVLKGHIALASALFPVGTSGSQLDVLARHSLWQVGLDYDHGTGHGVGSYLNVHEGPQRIGKTVSMVALRPGMIVSNEPGYYKTNAYGIRIENLVLVVEKDIPEGGERPLLGFETLTLAPIDLSLVDRDLLAPQERDWLNSYHAHVREKLLSHLNDVEQEWLKKTTKDI